MKRYSVETASEGTKRYFYIQDNKTLDLELLPSRYLMHKIKSNRSPNTVRRAAYAICYYLEYLDEVQMDYQNVYDLRYDEQNEHFVRFLYWLKEGKHKEEQFKKIPHNGTCNAYLKDVFRFYLFMESEDGSQRRLSVLSYNYFTTPNEVGVKRTLRFKSFRGYLKAEERNVRAAEQDEIVAIL